jgi:hypothetical protein
VNFDVPVDLGDGIRAEYTHAGHLLGSAFIRVSRRRHGQRILFGGDLGRYGRPVLPDPSDAPAAETLLLESTYGDRVHPDADDETLLADLIEGVRRRGGRLIIPSFAIGRAEEVLYWIKRLEDTGRIEPLPVYLDSPMAISGLQYYADHEAELDHDVRGRDGTTSAFNPQRFRAVATPQESIKVVASDHPAIVISASGMATGGRVLHHLASCLPNPKHTVLFVGFQAAGTRGRTLVDGAKSVKMHGTIVPVGARVTRIDSMSAHADANEIMRWLGTFKDPAAADLPGPRRAGCTGRAQGAHRILAGLGSPQSPTRRARGGQSVMSSPAAPSTDRPYRLEQIDDAAVVQLYADGFVKLSTNDRILVWHLYQAALAGRDIYYDQRYRHNLAMRDILEEIVAHDEGIPDGTRQELIRYTKLFWINTGAYNNLTARKFVLALTEEALADAAELAAANGARFRLGPGEGVRALIARYAPMFFDPAFDPMVTCKTPEDGRDILEASANNLYVDVTMADLERFAERHPLNSRVVKVDGRVIEQVYRLGGMYDAELQEVVQHLTAALPHAPPSLADALAR